MPRLNWKYKLYNEDCFETFKRLPDKSIALIITSPPYYLNKEYEKKTTYVKHCDTLQKFFIESERVLIPGGYAVVNFGDYFNSGNRFYSSDVPACYPASLDYFNWGVNVAGLDLQATRIWRKQFAKMGIPFVCNNHPRPIFDYEHIWTFRKKNGSNKEVVMDRKLSQRGVVGENWTSKAGLDTHCAAFPLELPTWALQVYAPNSDGVVMDPFLGSGTTGVACGNLNRKFIGCDNDTEHGYFQIAEQRIKEAYA